MRMNLASFLLPLAALLSPIMAQDSVLTERVLQMSYEAVKLSSLAYTTNSSAYAITDANGNITGYELEGYDDIHFYTEEPDQAVLAQVGGRCYIAFRGTNANLDDWEQNINLGSVDVYQDFDESLGSCEARSGFADFLNTSPVTTATEDLMTCVEQCDDPDDCLVITGHSQGGATSAILSILLYSLNPIVITFGMPPAVDAGCEFIPSERFYRFVNFRQEDNEDDDIAFDPVPFSPTFISKSVHYGHYLLVGPDTSAAKYLGFDTNYTFTPDFSDRQNEIAAHTLAGQPYSYMARIEGLLNHTEFPIPTDGFSNGVICEPQYWEICESRSCQKYACADKIEDLCIKGSCQNDEDCVSGTCIWDACAAGSKMVTGGCPCGLNRDCVSGDCDTSLFTTDWVCVLSEGETAPPSATPATNSTSGGVSKIKTLSMALALGGLFWN